jgi:aromatic-amino-acid transaminase
MFEYLHKQPADKIMALMGLFANDSRSGKIDLGVGVYKDQNGSTPIMQSVKKAEKILLENQKTKSYVGLLGSLPFVEQMIKLNLNGVIDRSRICGAQAPGGTGALHQLFLLLRSAKTGATVWISDPTWPNHPAILTHLGIKFKTYKYFNQETCEVDFGGMMLDLQAAKSGDVLLLHGCCHNPTGANLTLNDWKNITQMCSSKGITPLIDIAYQGFGNGLQSDVEGLQHMAKHVPEMMIGTSCSKNFGVYRDRVGCAIVVASNNQEARLAEDNLKSLNRLTFSFPPDHGATLVELILSNPKLLDSWKQELEIMRNGMLDLRKGLAEALELTTSSSRFNFIKNHRGMFSRLGLFPSAVDRLREEFGIYMVSDSRINIAGLQSDKLEFLASSISKVLD